MRVYIVAHGGRDIGYGHLIRMISLANILKRKFEVIFLTKTKEAVDYIGEKFKVIKLDLSDENKKNTGFNYGDINLQLEEVEIINKYINNDIVIVDSYNVSKEYFRQLKKQANLLIYIDDTNRNDIDVDIVVNGNLGAINTYKNQSKYSFVGIKYNLIREEFLNIDIKNKKEQIVITTGGSDPYKIMLKILQNINISKKIVLLIGMGYTKEYILEIKNYVENSDKFYECEMLQNADVVSVFCESKYAITSSGSTLYELLALNVNMLAFSYADNQDKLLSNFEKEYNIINIGKYDNINYDKLNDSLENLKYIPYSEEDILELKNSKQNILDSLLDIIERR